MNLKIISVLTSLLFIQSYGMEKAIQAHIIGSAKALVHSAMVPFQMGKKANMLFAATAAATTGYLLYKNYCENKALRQEKLYAKDFERLGVRFLDHLEIEGDLEENEPALNFHVKYCHLIQDRYQAPVHLQFINDTVGYGVFADTDIKKDQMIAEYTGILKQEPKTTANTHAFDYIWKYPTRQEISIDAKYAGNFTRFVNHSYHPNVEVCYVWHNKSYHLVYFAKTDIKKDEQLLVNYGPGYWLSRRIQPAQLQSALPIILNNAQGFYDHMRVMVPYWGTEAYWFARQFLSNFRETLRL